MTSPDPARVAPELRHLLGVDAPVPKDAGEARRSTRAPGVGAAGDAAALGSVRDEVVEGVPVRVYEPAGAGEKGSVLLWAHGGGFVTGSVAAVDGLCRRIAKASAALVVSVDYRLAPEHPYPAGLDDVETIARFLLQGGADLGISGAAFFVGGTSAGATLAAALCLRLRRRRPDESAVDGQVLVYPCLDPRLETRSAGEFASGYRLSRAKMRWFWEQYLGGAEADPEAAPLLASDLSGLPPALVVLAECDIMCDEGASYAERLSEAGVRCELRLFPGMLHGFVGWPEVTASADEAVEAIAAFVSSLDRPR